MNEESGDIVQVTETGFSGMLCAGNKTMKLYVLAGAAAKARCVDYGRSWRSTSLNSSPTSQPAQ